MITISVVMPTYNTAVPMLKEAVESILNQTFGDFEFIIIDDGSTNDSPAYLDALTDPRIRIIRNKENIGITKSLNLGFRAAQGKYIARMDSDDISLPERFEKQLAFMESHPDVIVCGTHFLWDKVFDMEKYRINLLFYNPGPTHPTAFFSHEAIIKNHIQYDETLKYAQDYGLWTEIIQYGKIYLIPEKVIIFRNHPNRISVQHREEQFQCHKQITKKLLSQLLDNVSSEEVDLHFRCFSSYFPDVKLNKEIGTWVKKLIKANSKKQKYNIVVFRNVLYGFVDIIVNNSFEKDMSKLEKVLLLFQCLPFSYVMRKVSEFSILRIKRICAAISRKK